MEYWTVPVDTKTRARLTQDELELGSIERDATAGEFLKFRDRFVAMKIAARIGVRAQPLVAAGAPVSKPAR